MKIVKYGNVTIIDKSSHEERAKRLQKPLQDFFIQARKDIEENEKSNRFTGWKRDRALKKIKSS